MKPSKLLENIGAVIPGAELLIGTRMHVPTGYFIGIKDPKYVSSCTTLDLDGIDSEIEAEADYYDAMSLKKLNDRVRAYVMKNPALRIKAEAKRLL